MTDSKKPWQLSYWTISLIALALPIVVWWQSNSWQIEDVSLYQVFPLFGLLAFTIFWLQLLTDVFKKHWAANDIPVDVLMTRSSLFFMIFVVLHPLLLAIAQYQGDASYPPSSLFNYVSPTMYAFISIAIISLAIFLLTELMIRLKDGYYFKKFEKMISGLNYLAFFFVFIHSIKLGSHLQNGLLQSVWWVYGVTGTIFIVMLLYRSYSTGKN